MPEYPVYRDELIQSGWLPLQGAGDGGFQELTCGRGLCSAEWQHESGSRTLTVILWPDGWDEENNSQIYRVAPYISD